MAKKQFLPALAKAVWNDPYDHQEMGEYQRGDDKVLLNEHACDVAAVMKQLLQRSEVRERLVENLSYVNIYRLSFLAGLHDAGKVNTAFQRDIYDVLESEEEGYGPLSPHCSTLWAVLVQPAESWTQRVGPPGRKALAVHDAGLVAALERLVDPATRGDPTGPLRWTCSSAARLARELQDAGHRVSERSVNRLLHELGYSLQANRKTLEGKQHPDRDAQFNHINPGAGFSAATAASGVGGHEEEGSCRTLQERGPAGRRPLPRPLMRARRCRRCCSTTSAQRGFSRRRPSCYIGKRSSRTTTAENLRLRTLRSSSLFSVPKNGCISGTTTGFSLRPPVSGAFWSHWVSRFRG